MCGSNGACRSTCTDATAAVDCVPGNYCSGGSCVPKKGLGTMCAADGECGKGHCVESVCCDTGPCGQCFSCALPGSLGMCTQVTAGTTDPSGMCVNQGTLGCGTTGKCDLVGACAYQDGSTMCAGASCSGSALTSTRFCDGKGTCAPPATVTECAPFSCDATALACFTTCADDTSCASTATCDVPNASCKTM
jgi:hypothetical protein